SAWGRRVRDAPARLTLSSAHAAPTSTAAATTGGGGRRGLARAHPVAPVAIPGTTTPVEGYPRYGAAAPHQSAAREASSAGPHPSRAPPAAGTTGACGRRGVARAPVVGRVGIRETTAGIEVDLGHGAGSAAMSNVKILHDHTALVTYPVDVCRVVVEHLYIR